MIKKELNAAIESIRRQDVPEAMLADASARVRDRLQQLETATTETGDERIEGCEAFQALLPALVAGTLSESRRLLVDDHTRECVPCRRALVAVRSGRPIDSDRARRERQERRPAWQRGLIAATVAIVALGGLFVLRPVLWPTSQLDVAQVASVEGRLFKVSDDGMAPLEIGSWIDGRETIRSGGVGSAYLKLSDGSTIEVAPRTSFEIIARPRGQRIRVDRGSVIVQASDQREGTLDVTTEELLASVKGTVFAVTHGAKGSRVSVIEGEVHVAHGRENRRLYPGDQLVTHAALRQRPLAQEIAWSQDVDGHLALLKEFTQLRRDLTELMADAPKRHSTRLLDLMPSDTVVYVALPNPTATLGGAYDLIRERVESNETLSQWWSEVEANGFGGRLDSLVQELRQLGDAMGEELVIALSGLDLSENAEPSPLLVGEVHDAGALRQELESHLAKLHEEHPEQEALPVRFIDDLASAAAGSDEILIWIDRDTLVASNDMQRIRAVDAQLNGSAVSSFAGSALHERLTNVYSAGTEIVGAVDVARIIETGLAAAELGDEMEHVEAIGILDAEHLIFERKQDESASEMSVTLTLSDDRKGLLGVVAEPGPIGALDFFSPDASFVAAGAAQDPVDVLDQLFELARAEDPEFDAHLAEVESELGLSVRDDLVAPLGGEAAIGVDGPVLPIPSWKIVLAVYDEIGLQQTVEHLATVVASHGEAEITITEQNVSGQTYYEIAVAPAIEGIETVSAHYTYFDGYLVAAPTQALVQMAIQYYEGGTSIVGSEAFQSLLPDNGYVDFSAVVYNGLGQVAEDFMKRLPMGDLSPEQKQSAQELVGDLSELTGPSMFCLFADRDQIQVTSRGPSLLPFSGVAEIFGVGASIWGGGALEALLDGQDAAAPVKRVGQTI